MLLAVGAVLLGVGAGTGIAIMRDTNGGALPRVGGISVVRRKLARTPKDFWPSAGSSSSIPVLAVLPNVDTSFGLNAAEDPNSRFARNRQSTRRGAGEPQSPRQSDDPCRRFRC